MIIIIIIYHSLYANSSRYFSQELFHLVLKLSHEGGAILILIL